MRRSIVLLLTAVTFAISPILHAQVTVGIDISTTGPGAALGIQTNNAVRLWPNTLGGLPARYVVVDDGTDVTRAVTNIRKLITEDNVDAIVGPNTTPAALAALPVVTEARTPMIALAGGSVIVEPLDASRFWAFKMPQNDSLMAGAVVADMQSKGYATVAFLGFADAYGDSWWNAFSQAAAGKLKIVAQERFQRSDSSLVGQALRILSSKPDAVLIAASGTPAVLPQQTLLERGYTGQIYQTHGIGTVEFLRVGGAEVDGTLFPTGPGVLARQLPDANPVKKTAMAFANKYEAQYGPNTVTQFAADAYGAWMLLDSAVARALKAGARPGTPKFRAALRDAIEQTRGLVVPNGVLNISASDHQGFDARARVMGIVRGGKFTYAPQ